MFTHLVRLAKRVALLLPGIVIAYFSVHNIFPTLDKRLPLAVAIFFTYVIGAYALIPALMRVVRLIAPPKHLPFYCITPDGFASDPLNIGLVGSREQIIEAMHKAGWHMADPHLPRFVIKEIFSTLFKRPYPTAPMSNLYLFGRKQDIGFEIPLKGGRGNRHHVRFWATTYQDINRLSRQTIHWYKRREQLKGDNLLWVGAASRDVGIAFIRHNVQVTHMVHPDTDAERELIAGQLQAKRVARQIAEVRLGEPYQLINRVWRGYLESDGVMCVLNCTKRG